LIGIQLPEKYKENFKLYSALWKLLKADLRPFFLKRHFIFKYNSKSELSADIREASTVETFKSRLKTFLFKKAFYL
jgi:hypothetical protein